MNSPSDDPVAAAQILGVNSELTRIDQYEDNADAAESHLQFEESLIDSGEESLQRIRELVLQANNATQSNDTRAAIAVEIEERLDELLALGNATNSNGEYVFAGFQSNTIPFERSGGGYQYAGDDGQRLAQIGASSTIPTGDSGRDVFMRIASGNGDFVYAAHADNTGSAQIGATSAGSDFIADTYQVDFVQALPTDPVIYTVTDSGGTVVSTGTYEDGDTVAFAGASINLTGVPNDGDQLTISPSSSQDIFTTIDAIVGALKTADETSASQAKLGTQLALSIENIDQAMVHFSEVRTDIGSRLNRIDSQRSINEDVTLQLQETLSNIEDLDFTEAISELNLQLTALEAAQPSYVSVQQLSLFNYL